MRKTAVGKTSGQAVGADPLSLCVRGMQLRVRAHMLYEFAQRGPTRRTAHARRALAGSPGVCIRLP